MKKIVTKILFATILSCAFVCTPIFASDNQEEYEEEATNKEKMKEGSKEFFSGLGGSIKDAGNTVKTKAKSITQAAYIGEWQFENGECVSTLIIEDNGNMYFIQKDSSSTKVWDGTYTASNKQFVFNVESDGSKPLDENWVINYKAKKNKTLQITSKKLPKDANGYSFAKATLFTPVEEEE